MKKMTRLIKNGAQYSDRTDRYYNRNLTKRDTNFTNTQFNGTEK